MPVVVRCPSCSGSLRVADDLIGRKVRCPACSTVFDAPAENAVTEPPEPAAPPAPVETVPVDPWRVINLSLDDPSAPPPPPAAPRGAVEVGREEEEIPVAPRKARLSDEHDDMQGCPSCRRLVYRDARRCNWCGERFDEDGPRHDGRSRFRRDTELHRGGTVLTLGILSLLGPFLACPTLGVTILVGAALGGVAWMMGSIDLAKMKRHEMDDEGQANTRAGYVCGIIGLSLNLAVLLTCGGVLGYSALYSDRAGGPRWVAPPPPPQMKQKM